MQTTANITRFITGNSSRLGFADLKSLINSKETFQRVLFTEFARTENSKKLFTTLANRFIALAEQVYSLRDYHLLEEVALVLINLPLPEAQQIGLYYQGILKYRNGQRDEARIQIEKVADCAPLAYRARAIQSLGGFHHDKGELTEALGLHLEASRLSQEKGGGLMARMISELRLSYILSDLQDHQRALSKIESSWPLVQQISKQYPYYFYAYHNSLAVELAEVGRFDEAEAACQVALASPFAQTNPEWFETREEIAQKRDSKWSDLSSSPEPLLATELNSVSNQDLQTATDSNTESEVRPQTAQAHAVRYLRAVTFHFSIRKYNFQIPSNNIPAKAAAVNQEFAQSILDRLDESIGPRSPPCLF